MQQNTGTVFCPTVIITTFSVWKECRKTSRKTAWQMIGNREQRRRKQTAQQDARKRQRKTEGERILSHPYRELQHNGAYNYNWQLWLAHQSVERHPLGQKNSITNDASCVVVLPFQKMFKKRHTPPSTTTTDSLWGYKARSE